MSAALVERVAEVHETPSVITAALEVAAEKSQADPHPLVPVFVLGTIALMGALLAVGTMMAMLAIRGTGLDAAF